MLQSGSEDANNLIRVNDAKNVEYGKDISVLLRKLKTLRGGSLAASVERDIDDQPGLIAWKRTLAAGETWRIRHQYTVTYPARSMLRKN